MAKSPLGAKTRLSAVTWSIEEIFFSSVSHFTSKMSAFSRSHEFAFGTSVLHASRGNQNITHVSSDEVCDVRQIVSLSAELLEKLRMDSHDIFWKREALRQEAVN